MLQELKHAKRADLIYKILEGLRDLLPMSSSVISHLEGLGLRRSRLQRLLLRDLGLQGLWEWIAEIRVGRKNTLALGFLNRHLTSGLPSEAYERGPTC